MKNWGLQTTFRPGSVELPGSAVQILTKFGSMSQFSGSTREYFYWNCIATWQYWYFHLGRAWEYSVTRGSKILPLPEALKTVDVNSVLSCLSIMGPASISCICILCNIGDYRNLCEMYVL
jgi:hypothetical protein